MIEIESLKKIKFEIKEQKRDYLIIASDEKNYEGYVNMKLFMPHANSLLYDEGEVIASIVNTTTGKGVTLTVKGEITVIDKRDAESKEYKKSKDLPKDIRAMIMNDIELDEYDVLVEDKNWFSLEFFNMNKNEKIVALEQTYENSIPEKAGKLIKRLCRLLNWFEYNSK